MGSSLEELKKKLALAEGICHAAERSWMVSFLDTEIKKQIESNKLSSSQITDGIPLQPGVGLFAILSPEGENLPKLLGTQTTEFIIALGRNQPDVASQNEKEVEKFKAGVLDRLSSHFEQVVKSHVDKQMKQDGRGVPDSYVQAVQSFADSLPGKAQAWLKDHAKSDLLLKAIVEAEARIECMYINILSANMDTTRQEVVEDRRQGFQKLQAEFEEGKESIEFEQAVRNPRSPYDGVIGGGRTSPLDLLRAGRRGTKTSDTANSSTDTVPGPVPAAANASTDTEPGLFPTVGKGRGFNVTVPGQVPGQGAMQVATEKDSAAFLKGLENLVSTSPTASSRPSTPATPPAKLPPIVQPDSTSPDSKSDGSVRKKPG